MKNLNRIICEAFYSKRYISLRNKTTYQEITIILKLIIFKRKSMKFFHTINVKGTTTYLKYIDYRVHNCMDALIIQNER